jgi:hypothetical protein
MVVACMNKVRAFFPGGEISLSPFLPCDREATARLTKELLLA